MDNDEDHEILRGMRLLNAVRGGGASAYYAVMNYAESADIFCDGEETFFYDEWFGWRSACHAEGRMIQPAEFKSLPEDVKKGWYEKTVMLIYD